MDWKYLHYFQTSETHFSRKSWKYRLNPNNLPEEEILAFLHGKYEHDPSLHKSSKKLLEAIISKIIPKMRKAATEITAPKYKEFYSKKRERTSYSPSGLHLGHLKSTAHNEELVEVIVEIISIVVNNAYNLKR